MKLLIIVNKSRHIIIYSRHRVCGGGVIVSAHWHVIMIKKGADEHFLYFSIFQNVVSGFCFKDKVVLLN